MPFRAQVIFLPRGTRFEVPSRMQIVDRTYYLSEQVKSSLAAGDTAKMELKAMVRWNHCLSPAG